MFHILIYSGLTRSEFFKSIKTAINSMLQNDLTWVLTIHFKHLYFLQVCNDTVRRDKERQPCILLHWAIIREHSERAPARLNCVLTVKMEFKLDYIGPPNLRRQGTYVWHSLTKPGQHGITRTNTVGFDH